MATTRIPLAHPPLQDLRSLDETISDSCPLDNGRPAVASAVRVLEDAAVYVATRMQMGYGGTCRFVDLGPGAHILVHYLGTEAFTASAMCYFGLTANASYVGSVGVTSSIVTPTTTPVDVSPVADYTDHAQMTDYSVAVQIGDGDSGDLAINKYVQLTALVSTGALRVWYFVPHPVGLTAGSEVAI